MGRARGFGVERSEITESEATPFAGEPTQWRFVLFGAPRQQGGVGKAGNLAENAQGN